MFIPFKEKKFNPLAEREKLFLNVIKDIKEPFYIIVSPKNNKSTIRHETAHAMFYLNTEYKAKVLKILSKMNLRSLKKKLTSYGYCKEVLLDEANAFIVDGEKRINSVTDNRYVKKFANCFNTYVSK